MLCNIRDDGIQCCLKTALASDPIPEKKGPREALVSMLTSSGDRERVSLAEDRLRRMNHLRSRERRERGRWCRQGLYHGCDGES